MAGKFIANLTHPLIYLLQKPTLPWNWNDVNLWSPTERYGEAQEPPKVCPCLLLNFPWCRDAPIGDGSIEAKGGIAVTAGRFWLWASSYENYWLVKFGNIVYPQICQNAWWIDVNIPMFFCSSHSCCVNLGKRSIKGSSHIVAILMALCSHLQIDR